eukprot:1392620-Amorphochlora_amoeboformis.AAC.1
MHALRTRALKKWDNNCPDADPDPAASTRTIYVAKIYIRRRLAARIRRHRRSSADGTAQRPILRSSGFSRNRARGRPRGFRVTSLCLRVGV